MKNTALLACVFALTISAGAQQPGSDAATLKPADNLVIENIPPIPVKIAEETARYGESRAAALYGWHPMRHEILIGTRFGDTVQVHSVAMPTGARRQLTFYPDRVLSAAWLPNGDSFIFQKDTGGGEWYQLYRYQMAGGAVTLLTDGKSRNESYLLAHKSSRLVYSSTQRTGKDTDLWTMDAADPVTAHMLLQVEGGGWMPLAWSPDNRQIVVSHYISINESYLWLIDAATGEKKALTPKGAGEPVAYSAARFSRDGKSLYVVCDRDSEFQRLARFDMATMTPKYLTTAIPWDVEHISASEDGKWIAFSTNENGLSKLYLLDTATDKYRPLGNAPAGVIGSLAFHPDGRTLALEVNAARSADDVYSIDIATEKLDRWTASETGGLNPANFAEPTLVKWKSFDGREISGFLYAPDPAKFPGKRPVVIDIHGGP